MKHRILLAVVGLITTGLLIGGLAKATSSTAVDAATTTATTTTASNPSPPRGMMHGERLTELATLLGLSTTDLQAKIDAGTPLYNIATEQGLTYSKLVEKQQATYQAEINSMVSSGFITSAQAEQFMSTWKERVASDPQSVFMGGHGHGFGRR